MFIEIPRTYVAVTYFKSDELFDECRVMVDEDWLSEIEEKYIVEDISYDPEQEMKFLTNNPTNSSISTIFEFTSGKLPDDDATLSRTQKWFSYIDSLPYRLEFAVEVKDKRTMTIGDVSSILAERYLEILNSVKTIDTSLNRCSNENLVFMCEEIIKKEMVDDKISRWLGFIQGCMAMKGYIDVDDERKFSRPLFQCVYKNQGTIQNTNEKS